MDKLYNSLADNTQREAFLQHFGCNHFTWVPQKFEDMPVGFQERIINKSKLPDFEEFKIPVEPVG